MDKEYQKTIDLDLKKIYSTMFEKSLKMSVRSGSTSTYSSTNVLHC